MMASGRVCRGSEMAAILQNEGISPQAIEAFLASTKSSPGFIGSSSMMSFEDVRGSNIPGCSSLQQMDIDEAGVDDLDESFNQPAKKRRLTIDQVQFLERSFEVENKLEPERKVELARDLGLQPRQVAIWFQNRRARWKTKQLEKDYEALKSSFDSLKGDYEGLVKEKEKLKTEVQVLTDKLLLKEEEMNSSTPFGHGSQAHQQDHLLPLPNMLVPASSEVKRPDRQVPPLLICKQEEICSANSAVLDSDSSHYTDEVAMAQSSSNALEGNHSDLSQYDAKKAACRFPKLEDSSCGYEFALEDHQFLWLWANNY